MTTKECLPHPGILRFTQNDNGEIKNQISKVKDTNQKAKMETGSGAIREERIYSEIAKSFREGLRNESERGCRIEENAKNRVMRMAVIATSLTPLAPRNHITDG